MDNSKEKKMVPPDVENIRYLTYMLESNGSQEK